MENNKASKNNFEIPRQLQKEGFGFVKLPPKSKDPFETEWQKNPYNTNQYKLIHYIHNIHIPL